MRKQARECCYQLIFEYLFLGTPEEDTLLALKEENKLDDSDISFIQERLSGIAAHEEELKKTIGKLSEAFALERIYKTDLAALLFGTYELLYCSDIPPAVAIKEAVDLAAKFSGEKSGNFVNGILASVLKDKNGSDN